MRALIRASFIELSILGVLLVMLSIGIVFQLLPASGNVTLWGILVFVLWTGSTVLVYRILRRK
ncbi:MAG: hypothetical protein MUC42_05025 [Bryobacter sp.]|jgi:hypothetical protein|nr:hypothetical protein [Bryobacter sp.]